MCYITVPCDGRLFAFAAAWLALASSGSYISAGPTWSYPKCGRDLRYDYRQTAPMAVWRQDRTYIYWKSALARGSLTGDQEGAIDCAGVINAVVLQEGAIRGLVAVYVGCRCPDGQRRLGPCIPVFHSFSAVVLILVILFSPPTC